MDNISELQATYRLLGDHIDSFVEYLLSQGQLHSATVYQYPTHTDEDIATWPSLIELQPVHDQEALLMALDHMKKNTIVDKQSGRIVPRLPGVVVYHHPDPLGCIRRLERINVIKNDLSDAIMNISDDVDVRFEAVKLALPNLIKKVATRHCLYANRPVKKISFSWVHRQSGQNLSKEQVLKILNRSLDYRNKNSIADPNFQDIVQEDILRISQMPAKSQFVIRRPLRVTPMINLKYEPGTEPFLNERPSSIKPNALSPQNYVAHSPMFIFSDPPKVYPFKNYVAAEHAKAQAELRRNEELMVVRLHLFYKKP